MQQGGAWGGAGVVAVRNGVVLRGVELLVAAAALLCLSPVEVLNLALGLIGSPPGRSLAVRQVVVVKKQRKARVMVMGSVVARVAGMAIRDLNAERLCLVRLYANLTPAATPQLPLDA